MGVTSIPQFHILRGGTGAKLSAPLVGAQADRLDAMIGQYKEAIDSSSSSSSSSSSTSSSTSSAPLPAGQMDLSSFIDERQVEALNQSTTHTKNHIFKRDDHYLESDCDEQLLVFIPFNQAVRIHSLSIRSVDEERAPKTVKIFINKNSMDFNSAEQTPAVQELEFSTSDVEQGTIIPLKFVKFQNVNSISFFFVDNQTGAETTAIKYLRLIGTPLQGTNMKEFQRVGFCFTSMPLFCFLVVLHFFACSSLPSLLSSLLLYFSSLLFFFFFFSSLFFTP
jgi:hypothetical protein